jgi:hypothetical protein
MLTTAYIIKYLFPVNNYSKKHLKDTKNLTNLLKKFCEFQPRGASNFLRMSVNAAEKQIKILEKKITSSKIFKKTFQSS